MTPTDISPEVDVQKDASDADSSFDKENCDNDELEVPENARATIVRLWHEAKGQHWRFAVVICSIVFYTVLCIAAPAYSAYLIDLIWNNIQQAWEAHTSFVIGWDNGGRQVLIFLYHLDGSLGILFPAVLCDGQFCRAPQPETSQQNCRQAKPFTLSILRRPQTWRNYQPYYQRPG